jgi:DNA modification methylase
MTVRILRGDVRDRLRDLPDESVHCVVTSPPYWGLRDYGHAGQIGLELTLSDHIAALVEVFGEVRRVLRADGTAWVNYGDAYAGSWGAQSRGEPPGELSSLSGGQVYAAPKGTHTGSVKRTPGLKPKDLMGLPWRLAFALQEAGWWLRQDIIWHKPNPMPESIQDRCTKAHEYVFLFAKSERYYYDIEAIKEVAAEPGSAGRMVVPDGWAQGKGPHDAVSHSRRKDKTSHAGKPIQSKLAALPNHHALYEKRNKQSVWTVPTDPFPEAHFATFPPALIEPCILAGCPVGGTVLDPFGGAGTTGLVADRLQRDAVLIELNPEYADIAERRIRGDAPMFAKVANE